MQFLNTDFLENEEIKLIVDRLTEGNPERNWVPAYHFHICDLHGNIMGACNLRIGYTDGLYYVGHIGYRINEEYRGHHYAAKACKLLFSLAQKHEMFYLYITCNPDNWASRKTCEYLQGEFLGVVELPEDNDLRINEGETQMCIFRFNL
ncbi:MAG TPA: GNAT family N-acetyltransferase [Candidatus Eisenbergiella merdavium]|uniref:GNAT family N-acetyltransferase n=1 Tax=Candidatus Eisenbergiella merdavium TaxID=2838551 RepID=A0A9D2NET9_9FIRM|nr:GNAT family N-acetyltransferase [Candidatus Eisenbergiella merdavium]